MPLQGIARCSFYNTFRHGPADSSFRQLVGNSNSKSKRYLRWLGLWLLNVLPVRRLRRLLPRRLDIIFDLKPE